MTILPVTFTFISLCTIVLMVKTGWIGTYRGATGVLRGDGGNPVLFKRIRAHGNFIETAPLAALALLSAESLGLGAFWLWAAVVSFFVGRILHWMLYDSKTRGIAMTFVTGPGLLIGLWTLWTLWM